MASKHSRDEAQDFQGLLNNLQDWELSFKDKDKKLRSEAAGKGKLNNPTSVSRLSEGTKVNGKRTEEKATNSKNSATARQYDILKDYDALSHLSSGAQSEDSFIDANSEKDLGNEFFKQKKFNEAIDCYSRSIALSPTAIAFANRAMAFIKVRRFQEAEEDCTEALSLDDRYIKAYSRRSTARKELGKLKESLDDAEFALRLEPQNGEIKKQIAEIKSLFQKEILKKRGVSGPVEGVKMQGKSKVVDMDKSEQKPQTVSTSSTDNRVAEIVEDHPKANNSKDVSSEISTESVRNSMKIDGSHAENGLEAVKRKSKTGQKELGPSVQDLAIKAATLAKAEAAKNIAPPSSAYQFEVSWRGLSGDRELQARLLKVTSPTALPGIFKNALSAPLLMDIIRCIATFILEDMDLGVQYLLNLTKIPRFDMIIMCLSSDDKAELCKIWDGVFSHGASDHGSNLVNLRSRYGMRQ